MTDSDILEALEAQIRVSDAVGVKYCDGVPKWLFVKILDLIDRQKTEIERLNKEVDRLSQIVMYNDGVTEMKVAEAIQEFAERLKNKLTSCSKAIDGKSEYHICDFDIDNLVKEMERESE